MAKRDDDIQMLYEWWLRNGDGSERPGVIEGDAFKELMDIVWELVMSTDSEADNADDTA